MLQDNLRGLNLLARMIVKSKRIGYCKYSTTSSPALTGHRMHDAVRNSSSSRRSKAGKMVTQMDLLHDLQLRGDLKHAEKRGDRGRTGKIDATSTFWLAPSEVRAKRHLRWPAVRGQNPVANDSCTNSYTLTTPILTP